MSGVVMRRLGDVCVKDAPIVYGILQPGEDLEQGVPYVRPTEISDGRIDRGQIRRTSDEIARKYERSKLATGDIVLSIVGTIGKVAAVPSWLDGGNITQSSARIRVDQEEFCAGFVRNWMGSHLADQQVDLLTLGVAVKRLNLGDVREMELPLPPLDEQRRIADTLDTADGIRRRHLQARDEAKALLAALSAREFTRLEEDASVSKVRLGDVATDRTGGQVKIKKGDYLMDGKVPVIDQGASEVAGYVDDSQACAEVNLPAVLFGDHTRRFKYVDSPFALGADGVKLLEPKTGWNGRFVYYAFVRCPLPDLGYSRHFKALKELEFTAPPLDEQRRIADTLDAADALARRHQAAADEAAALLASLSHDIFTRLEQEACRESA